MSKRRKWARNVARVEKIILYKLLTEKLEKKIELLGLGKFCLEANFKIDELEVRGGEKNSLFAEYFLTSRASISSFISTVFHGSTQSVFKNRRSYTDKTKISN